MNSTLNLMLEQEKSTEIHKNSDSKNNKVFIVFFIYIIYLQHNVEFTYTSIADFMTQCNTFYDKIRVLSWISQSQEIKDRAEKIQLWRYGIVQERVVCYNKDNIFPQKQLLSLK